jgi:integrase
MQGTIGKELLKTVKPKEKAYDIRDTKLKGFILRVQPSGYISYCCQHGRGQRIVIGPASVLTPAQARDKAEEILATKALGGDPAVTHGKNKKVGGGEEFPDLDSYLKKKYDPWATTHRKTGKDKMPRIKKRFPLFLKKPLADVDPSSVENWRVERISEGTSRATINRDISDLKAALSKAVEWGILAENPLKSVKPLKLDSLGRVRYLDEEEDPRFLKALEEREERIRAGRRSANKWRKERGYTLLPDLDALPFADHLKPMALVSKNTGIRRGELFKLEWSSINFDQANLTVKGEHSKSGLTRHVPLNVIALNALKEWRRQSAGTLVFPGEDDDPLTDIKTAWKNLLKNAKIKDFRWHDLRHDFASKLVMKGVDLNTVRELLGHKDIKMTLRYAHLAPGIKKEAVNRLV